MYLLYEFASHESPAELSKALWQHGVSHRVVQHEGKEQLWLVEPSQSQQAQALLQQWQDEPEVLREFFAEAKPKQSIRRTKSIQQWHKSPMTIAFLLLSVLVAAVTGLGEYFETLSWFTISSFDIVGNRIQFQSLEQVLAEGEYWRLITPAFIHFGAAHIIFNGLWIWDIGRKLEWLMGSILWLIFAIVVCIASNVGQYLINGSPLFGGLSGLVYGLVGFAWVMPYLVKGWPELISKPLIVFFVIWLIAGYTDIFAMIGLGSMANEAHLLGLTSGLALAGIYSVGFKVFKRS